MSALRLFLIGIFLLGFGCTAGVFIESFNKTVPEVRLVESRGMQSCLEDTAKLTTPKPMNTDTISDIIRVCFLEIDNQGNLNDFQLRRLAFLSRYYADRVTLWMVVLITTSGVLLAGLQLLASYNLALIQSTALSSDSSLDIEQGKLVFRSSITGLFVLLISFAFFLIYVRYIYVMPEVNVDQTPQTSTNQQAQPTLDPGGLGLPPGAITKPEPSGNSVPSPQAQPTPNNTKTRRSRDKASAT